MNYDKSLSNDISALANGLNNNPDNINFSDVKNIVDKINGSIKDKKLNDLFDMASNNYQELIDELDVWSVKDDNCNSVLMMNQDLINNFALYNNRSMFKTHFTTQLDEFFEYLQDQNLPYYLGNMNSDFGSARQYREILNGFIDSNGHVMLKDELGNYNPLFVQYFAMQSFYGTNAHLKITGTHAQHDIKKTIKSVNKVKGLNEVIFDVSATEDNRKEAYNEVSRITNFLEVSQYKRDAQAVSTGIRPTNSPLGVAPNTKIALMEDIKADMYNINGDTKKGFDACDAGSRVSPIQQLLMNKSLGPNAVSSLEKSMISYYDTQSGSIVYIKHAAHAISNRSMINTLGSEVSDYNLFRKMHSEGFNGFSVNVDHMSLENYYVKDYVSGQSRQVVDLMIVDSEVFLLYDGDEDYTRRGKVDSIFELFEALGGINTVDSNGETTDASIETIVEIMNHSDDNSFLKQYFIGYLVPKSAMKNGRRNSNSVNRWFDNDDTQLNSFSVSSYSICFQQDPVHELDDTDIAELSQVFSACIANGRQFMTAQEMYYALGQVAEANSTQLSRYVDDFLRLYNEGKVNKDSAEYREQRNKMVRSLGHLIFQVMEQKSDISDIGQSFMTQLKKDFYQKRNTSIIPLSNRQLMNNMTQAIQKMFNSSVRMRYNGSGNIIVTSYKNMQHFETGQWADGSTKNLMFMDVIREAQQQFPSMIQEWANGATEGSVQYYRNIKDGYLRYLQDTSQYVSKYSFENQDIVAVYNDKGEMVCRFEIESPADYYALRENNSKLVKHLKNLKQAGKIKWENESSNIDTLDGRNILFKKSVVDGYDLRTKRVRFQIELDKDESILDNALNELGDIELSVLEGEGYTKVCE